MIDLEGLALHEKKTAVLPDQSRETPLIGGWQRKETQDKNCVVGWIRMTAAYHSMSRKRKEKAMKIKKLFTSILVVMLLFAFAIPAFAEAQFHKTVNFVSTKCKQYYYTTDWISKYSGELWDGPYCSVSIDEFSSNPSNISDVRAQAFYAKTSSAAISAYRNIPSDGANGYPLTLSSGANSKNTMHMKITNLYSTENYYGTSNTINMKSSGCFWCYW